MLESGIWRTARTNNLYTHLREPCGYNGIVYAFGSEELYPATNQALLAYDIATDTWSEISQMPSFRYYCFTAAVNGKLYVMGGTDSFSNNRFNNAFTTVEVYDLETGEWSTGSDMPTAGGNGAVAVIGDKIYCIAGMKEGGPSPTPYLRTVQIYDVQSDTWSTGTDAPAAMNAPNATPIGTDIYLTGFMDSTSGTSINSYKYDTITGQWSAIEPQLSKACHSATGYYEGKIMCAGGAVGTWGEPYTEKFQIYNVSTDTWSYGLEMPGATIGRGYVYKDKFYAIGPADLYILEKQSDRRIRLLLDQGESQQLAGIILPSGVTLEDVDWSSADPSIVQVDENGLATGVSMGKAVVTVTAKDGSWSDSILIQVLEAEVQPEYRLSILLSTGETCRLAASDDPEEAFLWTSDDISVATVSDTGRVTAVAPGVTIITVMSQDGEFQNQVYVKVED